jgi:hypothetical protein
MTQNMRLIWANRFLNVVAMIGATVDVLMVVLDKIGPLADVALKLGIVPKEWIAVASAIGGLAIAAGKISKTPSPAIAAAVSPAQIAKGMPVPNEKIPDVPSWKDKPTPPAGSNSAR